MENRVYLVCEEWGIDEPLLIYSAWQFYEDARDELVRLEKLKFGSRFVVREVELNAASDLRLF